MGVKKSTYGLTAALINDIEEVFDGEKAICARVKVARDTWNKIKGNSGVKKETATNIVKRFFNTLLKSNEDAKSDDMILDQYFVISKEKYLTDGRAPSPTTYVIVIDL